MIENLMEKLPQGTISFNITGGTKIMSLAAYDVAKENNISTIYIDQNNKLTDLSTNQQFVFKNTIDLPAYFRLFGQQGKSSVKYNYADQGQFELKDLIMKNFKDLQPLFKKFRAKNCGPNNSFILKNSKFEIGWRENEQAAFLFSEKTGEELELSGATAFDFMFNTGWFEQEVAGMLSKWEHANELYLNTVFERRHDKTDKNEIDIIVSTEVKMFFFECKTNVADIKDIDKFRNVVKIFGGLAAKPILVTLFRPNERIIEKCEDLNIKVFWLTEGFNKPTKPASELINFLNKEYKIINPI